MKHGRTTTAKHVSSPTRLPEEEHYAIITGTTTDDGYGGRSPAIEYVAYSDRAEWEERIQELSRGAYHTEFRAIVVTPARVRTVIEVSAPKAKTDEPSLAVPPCQCSSCLGYNGWGVVCQGYTP